MWIFRIDEFLLLTTVLDSPFLLSPIVSIRFIIPHRSSLTYSLLNSTHDFFAFGHLSSLLESTNPIFKSSWDFECNFYYFCFCCCCCFCFLMLVQHVPISSNHDKSCSSSFGWDAHSFCLAKRRAWTRRDYDNFFSFYLFYSYDTSRLHSTRWDDCSEAERW